MSESEQELPVSSMPSQITSPTLLSDKLFDELLVLWQENTYIPDDLIEVTRQTVMPLSLPMRALNAYRNGQWEACANQCRGFYHFQPRLPNRMLGLMADAAGRCNRRDLLCWPLLQFGESALEEEELDVALSAFRQVFTFSEALEVRESPPFLMRMARDLGILSAGLSKSTEVLIHKPSPVLRVGWVTPRLPHHGIQNIYIEHFARHCDRSVISPFVYVMQPSEHAQPEDFCIPLEIDNASAKPSKSMALGKTKTPLRYMPDLHYSEGAQWLVKEMDKDEIDAVVFEGGVDSPLMWVASDLCNVPIKICLPGATNMYQAGISGTIYTDEVSLEREKAFWQLSWGEQLYIPGAVDCSQAKQAKRPDNEDLNLPKGALVIGTITDCADSRLSRPYLQAIEEILQACSDAYFLCIGQGSMVAAQHYMEEAKLEDRCRWLPMKRNRFSALKRFDLYLNETPIGGAEILREAMACKVPALSVMANNQYFESAGAAILGLETQGSCSDIKQYIERAIKLIKDSKRRDDLATEQHNKAKKDFAPQNFVAEVHRVINQLIQKQKEMYEKSRHPTVQLERTHERLGRRHLHN